MDLNIQQKSFLVCYVLAVIPEVFTDLHKVILEVRMRIMNNGSRDINEDETKQILERMQEHKLVAIEENKIRRKVKLSPQFTDPNIAEFIKASIFNTDPGHINIKGFSGDWSVTNG